MAASMPKRCARAWTACRDGCALPSNTRQISNVLTDVFGVASHLKSFDRLSREFAWGLICALHQGQRHVRRPKRPDT
jgi:hypothetical protein